MNLGAYNLESLRDLVRKLFKENLELKEKLDAAGVSYSSTNIFDECLDDNDEYDFDQGARIIPRFITDDLAKDFFRMFWGRTDVFARRSSKGGYFPQCKNRWDDRFCPIKQGTAKSCDGCDNKEWVPVDTSILKRHLIGYKEDGSDAIGVYPLFPNGTCRFLVFDFDNHEKGAAASDYANLDNEWQGEVDALRVICKENGIKPLVERSRSGRGAHLWIFFQKPISAAKARNFGFLLLDKGAKSVNITSFKYYDRMYPSQDATSAIGNLIALPLQGQALKDGNSAFVDENWNAYPDQWKILLEETPKLEEQYIDGLILKWNSEYVGPLAMSTTTNVNILKPWRRNNKFDKQDVVGKLHMILADGVYIDKLNVMPALLNQIRSMAAFDNPDFYKKKRMGYSNYYNLSSVYLGKDVDGYVKVPRGLRERILEECEKADINVAIEDERELGRPIRVSFKGDLRLRQDLAAQKMLSNTDGVLSAATAFGKTAVCAYMIAERKVNTLVLLHSKDLLLQWKNELEKFLNIDEEPPEYRTKTGRIKKREDVIGILHGSKNTLTGIIDLAMVGSINSKGELNENLNSYGMIIMDECHHAGSKTSMEVLQNVNAKYVYGVSATPKRGDSLDKVIYMMIGPIRDKYTASERALDQGIGHYIIPRYTRLFDTNESRENINNAYDLILKNEMRNAMIVQDVKSCIENKRTPVILTRTKEQAKYLYDELSNAADNVFLLYGDNTDKENAAVRISMNGIPKEESLILVATGQKIGEGFDFPRLDTLMIVAPVSFEGRLEQYVGRLNRDYDGKSEVLVYDYIDANMKFFSNMYRKRLRTYKKIGYSIYNSAIHKHEAQNAIYDSSNYVERFESDLVGANKTIVISSPLLDYSKVNRFISIVQKRQDDGVSITVFTQIADNYLYGNIDDVNEIILMMNQQGIKIVQLEEISSCFAVIDNELVWHGGMNLLGKVDSWDNLIRIIDKDIAAELIGMMGKTMY